MREPPTPPRSVDEDATAAAARVLALHRAAAPSASFAIFDEAPAPAASFAIFDDDAGGVADEAAAGSVRVFEDEAAAPAALAARFDAEASKPTPVIFEDAPAKPKPTPKGFRIFEDNSDAPPKPTPRPPVRHLRGRGRRAAEAAPRGRVAFAVEEVSFEEKRASGPRTESPRSGPEDRAAGLRRAPAPAIRWS